MLNVEQTDRHIIFLATITYIIELMSLCLLTFLHLNIPIKHVIKMYNSINLSFIVVHFLPEYRCN